MPALPPRRSRNALLGSCLIVLAGCGGDGAPDYDLRGFGDGFDTSGAVSGRTAPPPEPDDRGVISYPTYQVVVAEPGDTVSDIAARLDLGAAALASYNGLEPETRLRGGEVVALPERVAEPSPATGAPESGTIRSPGGVDVATLAGEAIDEAEAGRIEEPAAASPAPAAQDEVEPVRHRVASGETAYSIARRYAVPVESLAEWNGLGPDYAVREGQYLLIPVSGQVPDGARTAAAAPPEEPPEEPPEPRTSQPGEGSPTPVPPSAGEPLPQEEASPEPAPESDGASPPSPDLAEDRTEASQESAQLSLPVDGSIIRDYAAGENEGIDIAASAGTPVTAAADGTVAAITRDTDQVPILVLRHSGELLTVYANIDSISVEKGDSISRGQSIAAVREGDPAFVHFEVREGFESVDPTPYLN